MGGLFSNLFSYYKNGDSSAGKARQTSLSTCSHGSSSTSLSSSSRWSNSSYESSSGNDSNPALIKAPNISRLNTNDSEDLYSVDNLCVDGITDNESLDTNTINANLPSEKIIPCRMFKSYTTSETVSYTSLTSDSRDYRKIKGLVKNKVIEIDKILQVNNKFLEKSYQLKLEEKIDRFGDKLEEHLLFHATSEENALNICKNNFDWRLCRRHKFGKGVNFSSSAKYALDSFNGNNSKVLILAKVSIFKSHPGDGVTILPRDGFDTTSRNDSDTSVQVKYEDAEFYPAYLIYHHKIYERNIVNLNALIHK